MRTTLGRFARLALYASASLLAVGAAVPFAQAVRGGCRPASWVAWHVALRKECLRPAYVCENMTTAKMLSDPEVASGYLAALRRGRDARRSLEGLVGETRRSYGCAPEAEARPSRRGVLPHLPPAASFDPPGPTTL